MDVKCWYPQNDAYISINVSNANKLLILAEGNIVSPVNVHAL